jgi:hypothetical protein
LKKENPKSEATTHTDHSSEPVCKNPANPLSSANAVRDSSFDSYAPGYSSGASTPVDSRSLDGSSHGSNRDRANSTNNAKVLSHSGSVLGLDTMIEARREEGALSSNVVHIEVSVM